MSTEIVVWLIVLIGLLAMVPFGVRDWERHAPPLERDDDKPR